TPIESSQELRRTVSLLNVKRSIGQTNQQALAGKPNAPSPIQEGQPLHGSGNKYDSTDSLVLEPYSSVDGSPYNTVYGGTSLLQKLTGVIEDDNSPVYSTTYVKKLVQRNSDKNNFRNAHSVTSSIVSSTSNNNTPSNGRNSHSSAASVNSSPVADPAE